MWVEPAPPARSDIYCGYPLNITLNITRPDGISQVYTTWGSYANISPFSTYSNRTIYWTYMPSQIGNYTFQASYPRSSSDGAITYPPFLSQPVTLTVESIAGNSWAIKVSMHQARSSLGVAVVDGKIYAIGGNTERGQRIYTGGNLGDITGGVIGANEEYNPATNTWASKKSMPTPRDGFAIASYQNKIYCIGGSTSNGITDITEVYDPATDTWETKASALTARSQITANVIDGKIYVIGGYPNGTLNEVYDPVTNSWETKAPMLAGPFNGYMTTVFEGKIYAIGGLSAGGDSNLNLIYDAKVDSWSYGASPPTSIRYGAAVATTGEFAPKRIYVIGETSGLRQGEPQYTNRIYDPANDSWTFGASIPTNRENMAIAAINDTFYAIGGTTHENSIISNYGPSRLNEQYLPTGYGTPDPTYQTPTPTPSPSLPLSPTLNPTPTPTLSPSPSHNPSSSPSPTQQPTFTPAAFPTEILYIAAGATIIIGIVAAAVVLKRMQIVPK